MIELIVHYDTQTGVVVPEGKIREYAKRYTNLLNTGSKNEIWVGQYAMLVAIRLEAVENKLTDRIAFVAEDGVQYTMNQFGAVHTQSNNLFEDVATDLTTELLLKVSNIRRNL